MHVTAPKGVSTCRSKNAKGERCGVFYDHVIACSSLKGKYHLAKNDYSFDALQTICFGINIKL